MRVIPWTGTPPGHPIYNHGENLTRNTDGKGIAWR